MARRIIPARIPGGGVPDVIRIQYATGQTFLKGAALALTSGQVVEATSPITGATLFGFAAEDAGSAPGYQAGNSPSTFTGRQQEVSVIKANRVTVFSGLLVNNSAVPVAATQADIGVNYGLKPYTNEWFVDKAQTTTNACVTIYDIDLDQTGLVFFKCLEARLLVG